MPDLLPRPLTQAQVQFLRDSLQQAQTDRTFQPTYQRLVTGGYIRKCPRQVRHFTNASLLAIEMALEGNVALASAYLEVARDFGGSLASEGPIICEWAIQEIRELTGLDIQPDPDKVVYRASSDPKEVEVAMVRGFQNPDPSASSPSDPSDILILHIS